MFILRFIGRILSIGLILFIIFIVNGKHARADGTGPMNCPAMARDDAGPVDCFRVPAEFPELRPG